MMKEVSIHRLQIASLERDFYVWGVNFQGKVKVIMLMAFNLTVNKTEASKHTISWQQLLEICKIGMPGLFIYLFFLAFSLDY